MESVNGNLCVPPDVILSLGNAYAIERCLGTKSHDLLSAVNKTDLYVEFVSERQPLPVTKKSPEHSSARSQSISLRSAECKRIKAGQNSSISMPYEHVLNNAAVFPHQTDSAASALL